MDNPLSTATASPLPDGHEPLLASVKQAHSQAASQLGKLQEGKAMLGHLRTEFDSLMAMGDNVTPEDVIKAAGNLVGKGGDPMQLANKLADMPQGGQAIEAWIQQQATQLGQSEKMLDQQLALARHSAGNAALHLIAMHHIGEQFKQAGAQPQGAPNGIRLN